MEVVEWRSELGAETIDLLSRAFARNPLHLAAFGPDSVVECNRVFFEVALSRLRGRRLVALHGRDVVGFMHWIDSPRCQLSVPQRLGIVPELVRRFGIRSTLRVAAWLSAWAKHDAQEPHWHFGPIGVAPEVQGTGVGKRLMGVFCEALDERGVVGFLETDKPENVAFYRKWQFDVTATAGVIGTKTYFMKRGRQGVPEHNAGARAHVAVASRS